MRLIDLATLAGILTAGSYIASNLSPDDARSSWQTGRPQATPALPGEAGQHGPLHNPSSD